MYTVYGKPNCPFCVRAKEYLENHGKEYEYIDVSAEASKRQELMDRVFNAVGFYPKTVPQIFMPNGEYVGGFDNLLNTETLKGSEQTFNIG